MFRTDASLLMGSGHLMRCLTLADAFKAQGVQCHFISRAHPGHLMELIRQRGFSVTVLPLELSTQSATTETACEDAKEPVHAPWLGCDWQVDAQQTREALDKLNPEWLVVDHYALDQRWEVSLRPHYQKLLVIDDLADRPHECDLLLDQNLGRQPHDYINLIPATCKVLVGPQYALLRPEFAALRAFSVQRRQKPVLKQVLITMGGVDQFNATGKVLQALKGCILPQDCQISVVMGPKAPWLSQVQAQSKDMPWPTKVLVNISDMAQCMANSDLAIGAAGSTSWERCCLGLPTLLVVLADNQRFSAQALQEAKAALLIGDVSDIVFKLPLAINASSSPCWLQQMSAVLTSITDGIGVEKVSKEMRVLNG